MAKATGTGAWWCVMAFDCMKRDSLSLAKCWKTSLDCGIGLMRICEVVSVEMFPTSVHTNCHLQTTEGYSQVTCTVSLSVLVFMFLAECGSLVSNLQRRTILFLWGHTWFHITPFL